MSETFEQSIVSHLEEHVELCDFDCSKVKSRETGA